MTAAVRRRRLAESAFAKRVPLTLAVSAALLALAVGGCGDGGDAGTTTQSASREDPRETDAGKSERAGQGGSASEGSSRREGAGGQSGGGGPSPAGAPADPASLPAPVEGSKRAAPGVPVSKGGDNSIQTWGTEASASEREEVTAILKAFYDARAAAHWARACSYLAARAKAEFAGFIKGRSGNAACAEAMRGFATDIPESAFAREARIDYVLSLRTGEGNAFLIYTRPGESKVFANGFADEGGTWKVISVGPTVVY